MNEGLEILLDWIEFTIHDLSLEDVFLQVLKLNIADFTDLERGRYGYTGCKQLGNISVLHNGKKEMGIHVVLSGRGCREYEAEQNILKLISRIDSVDGKITRLDIAIDDTQNIIPFDTILQDVKEGNIISKWKKSIEIVERELKTGQITGKTINFGSRTSEIVLRIYDKTKEQAKKRKKENPTANWVRMELEIKKTKAYKMQKILLETEYIGEIVSAVLNNYIRFVIKGKDKNKSRWSIASYWQNILITTKKLSLTIKPAERTTEDVKNWITKQVTPSLALCLLDNGGDIGELMYLIKKGRKRLKPKHLKMLKGDDVNVE